MELKAIHVRQSPRTHRIACEDSSDRTIVLQDHSRAIVSATLSQNRFWSGAGLLLVARALS